jgi:hypothetical protein
MDVLPSSGTLRLRRERMRTHHPPVWGGEDSGVVGGAAAHTGPGREGPEVWPPRKKVGAEERSPSAPLLGPSIVKEPGGEAPRVEAGEPHSPVLLPSGGDFASFKDRFAPLSPAFAPSEGDGERRELHRGRLEGEAVRRSLAFAPPDRPFPGRSPE